MAVAKKKAVEDPEFSPSGENSPESVPETKPVKTEWVFYHTRYSNDSVRLPDGYHCEFKHRFWRTESQEKADALMATTLFKSGEIVLHDGPMPNKRGGPKTKDDVVSTKDFIREE